MPAQLPGLRLLAPAAALLALAACSDEHRPDPDAASGCGDCDAPNDTPTSACDDCTPDQICVQVFNGTCGQISIACEPRNPACSDGTACTPGCMQWQCNDGGDPPFFRCDVGGCPDDVPGALHCYGP